MRPNPDPDVLSQAIAEPSRRALLENLRFGQKTVTQLVEATGLKQPNVSNHLAKMRQQGIVRAERDGRQVYYSLSMPFTDVLLRMHAYAANPSPEGSRATDASSTANTETDQEASLAPAQSPPASQPSEPQMREGGHAAPSPVIPSGSKMEEAADTNLAAWREAFFQAAMAGDEEQAITIVNSLLAQRLAMETIYTEVFARAINHIGVLYQQGQTDEAHEHMASAIIERMMARIVQFYTPVVRMAYRAVLGSVAGNWHILGLRMLADGLKRLGWETIFLGANVPTASFVSLAQGVRPDLVIVSCAMEEQSADAHDLLKRLDRLRQEDSDANFQLAVGGHYVQQHQEEVRHLPVDFTAFDLPEFLEVIKTRFSAV